MKSLGLGVFLEKYGDKISEELYALLEKEMQAEGLRIKNVHMPSLLSVGEELARVTLSSDGGVIIERQKINKRELVLGETDPDAKDTLQMSVKYSTKSWSIFTTNYLDRQVDDRLYSGTDEEGNDFVVVPSQKIETLFRWLDSELEADLVKLEEGKQRMKKQRIAIQGALRSLDTKPGSDNAPGPS